MRKICKNCYWWKETGGSPYVDGRCLRNAPKERYDVRGDDFCRDFDETRREEE